MAADTGANEQLRRTARQADRRRAAGTKGERLVRSELEQLVPHGWHVLDDVHWPGRPRTDLGHVLVGPGGVLVVESRSWSGTAQVRDGILDAGGYDASPDCEAVASAAAAVAALLEPRHRGFAAGVLCLARQDVPPQVVASGVTVVGRSAIVASCGSRRCVLGPAEVEAVFGHLQRVLADDVSPAPSTGGLAEPAHGPASPATPVVSASFVRLLAALLLAMTALFWLPLLAVVVAFSR